MRSGCYPYHELPSLSLLNLSDHYCITHYISTFHVSIYSYQMHLINTATCQLESTECMDLMHGLEYAILSHRWTQDEVLYMDMKGSEMEIQTKLRYRAGFAKILGACAQARKDGLKYIWIDTCCIDKNSSAELSEAINSMYR